MNKYERIVDAARQRFRYYGINKTTMQEIAQDAGVAVGTLYLYFSNKDALIVACAETFIEHHRQQIATCLAVGLPADERLRQYITARFRQAEETRIGSRHAREIAQAVLRVKPDRIEDEGRMMWETTLQVLRQGIADGLFDVVDPERDAQIFLFAIACFFPNATAQPLREPKVEELQTVIDWFLDVWKRGAGKAKKRPRATGARSR